MEGISFVEFVTFPFPKRKESQFLTLHVEAHFSLVRKETNPSSQILYYVLL